MSQNIDLFNIYIIIHKFIKYRKLELLDDKLLTQQQFNDNMNADNYQEIGCTDCIIVLFHYNDYINSKFINNVIKKYKKKFIMITKNIIIKEIPSPNVNYFYKHFKLAIPEHVLVPKHTILTKEKKIKVLNQLFTESNGLSTITHDDPMIIWCGAKIGDIVQLDYAVETSGSKIDYVQVKYNPKIVV
jgi:DNA-directed RNA polymerase subunit H (RpoH/RPB5)